MAALLPATNASIADANGLGSILDGLTPWDLETVEHVLLSLEKKHELVNRWNKELIFVKFFVARETTLAKASGTPLMIAVPQSGPITSKPFS